MNHQRTQEAAASRLRDLQGLIEEQADGMFAAVSAGRLGTAHGVAYELIQLVMEADDLLADLLMPEADPSPVEPSSKLAESAEVRSA